MSRIQFNSTSSSSTSDYAKLFYGKQNKDKGFADTQGSNFRLPLPSGTGFLTMNRSSQFDAVVNFDSALEQKRTDHVH